MDVLTTGTFQHQASKSLTRIPPPARKGITNAAVSAKSGVGSSMYPSLNRRVFLYDRSGPRVSADYCQYGLRHFCGDERPCFSPEPLDAFCIRRPVKASRNVTR